MALGTSLGSTGPPPGPAVGVTRRVQLPADVARARTAWTRTRSGPVVLRGGATVRLDGPWAPGPVGALDGWTTTARLAPNGRSRRELALRLELAPWSATSSELRVAVCRSRGIGRAGRREAQLWALLHDAADAVVAAVASARPAPGVGSAAGRRAR